MAHHHADTHMTLEVIVNVSFFIPLKLCFNIEYELLAKTETIRNTYTYLSSTTE